MGARLSHPRIPRHATLKKGLENLGYGVKDTDEYAAQPPGWAAYKPFADWAQAMSFDDYRALLETYTPEYAAEVSGVPAGQIREIARLLADPKRKGMSLWTMGFNQHVRGTWINNLVDNLHLLTGKISEPGNDPFSLTGPPSACGTTRETGALPPFEKTRPKEPPASRGRADHMLAGVMAATRVAGPAPTLMYWWGAARSSVMLSPSSRR